VTAARVGAVLVTVGALAALTGCLLPWETLTVDAAGAAGTTPVGALHGAGVLACAGGCGALLAVAHRLRSPRRSPAREGVEALAGTLLVLGAGLFTLRGGYRPGSGPGWSVTLDPGLVLTGLAGIAVLAGVAIPDLGRRAAASAPIGGG
jgi:hypothetical protein